jgi:hypothetical protein
MFSLLANTSVTPADFDPPQPFRLLLHVVPKLGVSSPRMSNPVNTAAASLCSVACSAACSFVRSSLAAVSVDSASWM